MLLATPLLFTSLQLSNTSIKTVCFVLLTPHSGYPHLLHNMIFGILGSFLLVAPWVAARVQLPYASDERRLESMPAMRSRGASKCPPGGDRSCNFGDLCVWNLESSVANASSLISGRFDPYLSIAASCANNEHRDTFTLSKLPLNNCVWNNNGVLDWGRQYVRRY